MKQLAKVLYGLNSVTCIFIGTLHTIVHYQDLVTAEVATHLNHEILVSGKLAHMEGLWQGMSLMMGALLIIIGLLHLFILINAKDSYPPVAPSLIMMLMLAIVMYAGYYHFGSWQVYGGGLGFFLQTICLILSIRKQ